MGITSTISTHYSLYRSKEKSIFLQTFLTKSNHNDKILSIKSDSNADIDNSYHNDYFKAQAELKWLPLWVSFQSQEKETQ